MKLAISHYSFAKAIKAGEMTFLDTPKKAKEMGFDAIEFAGVPGDTIEKKLELATELRALCEELELPVCAYAVGAHLYHEDEAQRNAAIEKLMGEARVAQALGAPVMRHDVCYHYTKTAGGRHFETMLPVIAEATRRVTEYAATLGVKTCSENHGYIAQDSDRVERLVATVGHENYGVLVDIGNFVCADEDSVHGVSRLASLAMHVHVKDFKKFPFGTAVPKGAFPTRSCNYVLGATIGDGDIPVAQCLAILKKEGYNGYVSIEYEGVGDCIAAIARGRDFLRPLLD